MILNWVFPLSLDLHPVFNVELLQPYYPPLLDTSEVVENLTPSEFNLDCIEKATLDRIMETQMKTTFQKSIQLYRVVKAGQILQQGKWLTRIQKEVSPYPTRTWHNGDHCFLGGEDWSMWISVVIHLFHWINTVINYFLIIGSLQASDFGKPWYTSMVFARCRKIKQIIHWKDICMVINWFLPLVVYEPVVFVTHGICKVGSRK